MKHNHYIFMVFILMLGASAFAKKAYKAVVIVPIADGVGSPIQTFFPESSPTKAYANLPVSGGMPLSSSCCPRLHQFLFNEIGTVIKEEGPEVLIKISNCFYITQTNNTPQHIYWTLKKNIISIDRLESKGISTDKFPPSISFENPESMNNERVATLINPWFDEGKKNTYSAGTRFLKTTDQHENASITVHLFDAQENEFTRAIIPTSYLVESGLNSSEKKVELFVKILKMWAHPNNGFIPYVWGGCSFTETTDQPFTEIQDKACSYYEINNFSPIPKPGLDCSNLILRAAQLAGIPFFFKNSYTMAEYLKKLQPTQQLSAGDIIWIPGHVMVVADIAKNTLIEARGYKYKGQGKVQEIVLNKVFKKIHTFDQLVAARNAKQPLQRLGDDGSIIETIKNFKLLSMRSIMEQ